jgi:hypothetical protein
VRKRGLRQLHTCRGECRRAAEQHLSSVSVGLDRERIAGKRVAGDRDGVRHGQDADEQMGRAIGVVFFEYAGHRLAPLPNAFAVGIAGMRIARIRVR